MAAYFPNEIENAWTCSRCADERPEGVTMRDFSRIEAGTTRRGFQVWCIRHECTIAYIDFRGNSVPAPVLSPSDIPPEGPVVVP
jgi:hypothetical protein